MQTKLEEKINLKHIDYKDTDTLRKFLSPHGQILSRKRTRLTADSQRKLAQAVKRARFMGLVPYIEQ